MKQEIIRRVNDTGNQLCVGVDPHLDHMPPIFTEHVSKEGLESGLKMWIDCVLEAATPAAAVKFQSALFEQHGAMGWSLLEYGMKKARSKGFFVIYDAKRGDISSTMAAYGRTAFDLLGADALTINLYMGCDVLKALLPWLQPARKRGVFVVWVTSNPSGTTLQEKSVCSGGTVASSLLEEVEAWCVENGVVESLGLVVGAQQMKNHAKNVDKIPALIPGIGAQGGKISDIHNLLGLNKSHLVNVSRGITSGGGEKEWEQFQSSLAAKIASFSNELT